MALARIYPDKLVLGLEIRAKIVEYVKLKIEALRKEANDMVSFQNASCFRTNCQRYLPNYFRKGQVGNQPTN
jgi:tRNA G46 methylase TrmB